jgi:hypothetical protein
MIRFAGQRSLRVACMIVYCLERHLFSILGSEALAQQDVFVYEQGTLSIDC